MKCNIGTIDRIIRRLIGISFAIFAAMKLDSIMAIPSIIIVYTVITRYCPAYYLIGINTGCNKKSNKSKHARESILEGIASSAIIFLLVLIIYLVIKYIILTTGIEISNLL